MPIVPTGVLRRFCIALMVAVPLMAVPAARADNTAALRLRAAFADAYGAGFSSNQLARYVSQLYGRFDRNLDGIDAGEIAITEKIMQAQRRARAVGRILRYDLDGDATVTRDEVRAHVLATGRSRRYIQDGVLTALGERWAESAVDRIMKADPDGDGKIGPDDYAALSDGRGPDREAGQVELARTLLSLDPDGDGRLTQIEALSLVVKAFGGQSRP